MSPAISGRARVAAFAYHEVTDDPTSTGFQRRAALPYKQTRASFDAHLDGIARSGTPALVTHLDLAAPGRHLVLTFDDGGRSALEASEMLAARGWRAHFFVVTSLIGARGFLSAGEIRRLRAEGHEVGSHSHTHPDIFRDLARSEMDREWHTSRAILSDLLGEPCITASVPGGDISDAVLRSAAGAGYRFLFTSEPWLAPRRVSDCWVLGRFGAKAGTTAQRIGALARFDGWTRALAERRLKGAARRSLPALYRLYVRSMTRPSESTS